MGGLTLQHNFTKIYRYFEACFEFKKRIEVNLLFCYFTSMGSLCNYYVSKRLVLKLICSLLVQPSTAERTKEYLSFICSAKYYFLSTRSYRTQLKNTNTPEKKINTWKSLHSQSYRITRWASWCAPWVCCFRIGYYSLWRKFQFYSKPFLPPTLKKRCYKFDIDVVLRFF